MPTGIRLIIASFKVKEDYFILTNQVLSELFYACLYCLLYFLNHVYLGVSIDNMFVILSAWRHTSYILPVEERMGQTFKTAAISITVTSLTDALALATGAITVFRAVSYIYINTFQCLMILKLTLNINLQVSKVTFISNAYC